MDRWAGKVALVTGASSGIGAQIVKTLAQNGMKVIAVARRQEKLIDLAKSINKTDKLDVYPLRCDLRKESDILGIFSMAEELGGIDVLINNAGVISDEPIIDGNTETFREIMDVNVIAMAICTREFSNSIKRRDTSGHIININSLTGHFAEVVGKPLSLYCASKYAVTGMTHSLRNEFALANLDIKITSISPGAVKTEMLSDIFSGNMIKSMPVLEDKDVVDAVIYALSARNAELCEIMLHAKEKKLLSAFASL